MDNIEYVKHIEEKLAYYEIKAQLTEFVLKRIQTLVTLKTETEYDYCELQGQIKELENILNFTKEIKPTGE